MTAPIRIQRKRERYWTAPPGAIYCGRPGMFGNPFKHRTRDALARVPAADLSTPWEYETRNSCDGLDHAMHWPNGDITEHHVRYMTRTETIATFRRALIAPTPHLRLFHRPTWQTVGVDLVRFHLAGQPLMCWCPLDQSCHVDVLLWAANASIAEVKEATDEEYEQLHEAAAKVGRLHPAPDLRCELCKTSRPAGLCCSAHGAALCHGCYRRYHHVERCVDGCARCIREGLDPHAPVPHPETCTGPTARWCPIHGTCACPDDSIPELHITATLDDPRCRLHAPDSTHAEATR